MKLPDISAEEYRTPLKVTKTILFRSGDGFPVCPRCDITIEREYMRFCDRCGQQLDWKDYRNAVVIQK